MKRIAFISLLLSLLEGVVYRPVQVGKLEVGEDKISEIFKVEGAISKASMNGFQLEYDRLPTQLKNPITRIVVSNQVNRYCGIESIYQIKGCARSDETNIYLDNTYREGDLLHESIHVYSYQENRVFSETFLSIYQEEGNRVAVQAGNTHNEFEYFVSAYLLFMQDPLWLQSICPKTFEYYRFLL